MCVHVCPSVCVWVSVYVCMYMHACGYMCLCVSVFRPMGKGHNDDFVESPLSYLYMGSEVRTQITSKFVHSFFPQ